MIHELDSVILTSDLPEHGLCAGDVGTDVLVHRAAKDSKLNLLRWMEKQSPWFHFSPRKFARLDSEKSPTRVKWKAFLLIELLSAWRLCPTAPTYRNSATLQ